jgi:hypothetical protein
MSDTGMLNVVHDARLAQCQVNSQMSRGAYPEKQPARDLKSNTDQQFMQPDYEGESLVRRDWRHCSWKAMDCGSGCGAVPGGGSYMEGTARNSACTAS